MSRPVGCLVWLIVLIAALIVASLLFGGFQKGTKASGEPRLNSQQVTVFAAGHSDGALAWPCA